MRNKIDYGNNMLCTQLLWAERTDRCCCTTISDSEYEQGLLPHCKCLYSGRSDCKSDRADYFEYKDSISSAQFNLPSGRYYICVTKQGYIPYITDVTMEHFVYIQNENFNNDHDIQGSFISVGSDVTTQKPQGPVSISNGKTILRCKEDVTITKDFEVKLGAELEIRGTE